MKKFLIAACLFALASASYAGVADRFKSNVGGASKSDAENYARDIGLIAGMNDFHDGKAVDTFGFDVGVSGNFLMPSNKLDDKNVFIPMLYGSVKIPILGLNIAARGTSFEQLTSVGGGLKWSVLGNTILPFFPDITVGAFYDRMSTDYYNIDHLSASISASVKVLMLEPYVGAGYDYSRMSVNGGGTASKGGTRLTGGVNFHILPVVYVFGAYVYAGDTKAVQVGAGARF
ncbi:MAG: hypothetical protein LBI01_03890 [Elusimicrobium sp.]|jgi:hypothetical protein|nr:hypothetical protein [Elusimicrobium sp.]